MPFWTKVSEEEMINSLKSNKTQTEKNAIEVDLKFLASMKGDRAASLGYTDTVFQF